MTKDLEGRLLELEQQLANKPRSMRLKRAIGGISILAIIVVGLGLIIWEPWKPTNQSLPPNIVSQADFPVYHFSQDIPLDYRLDAKSASYSSGVLSYVIKSGNRAVTVTQQRQPAQISPGLYPKAEAVSGVDGEAILTFNGIKTTGALFSRPQEGKSSLVFLSGNDQVQAEDIKQLLRSLRPYSQNPSTQ